MLVEECPPILGNGFLLSSKLLELNHYRVSVDKIDSEKILLLNKERDLLLKKLKINYEEQLLKLFNSFNFTQIEEIEYNPKYTEAKVFIRLYESQNTIQLTSFPNLHKYINTDNKNTLYIQSCKYVESIELLLNAKNKLHSVYLRLAIRISESTDVESIDLGELENDTFNTGS